MTKQKNARSGKKPANYKFNRPSRNPRSSIASQSLTKGVHKVCGLSDPFCEASRGSRIPDDDSSPSVPITIKSTYYAGTGGSGSAAIRVRANPSACFSLATAISGTNVTTWGGHTAMIDYAAVATSFSKYRMVSFGVRIYPVVAPTAQSGSLRVITSPELTPTPIDLGGGLWEAIDTVAFSEADVYWVGKPSGTTWKEYVDIAGEAPYTHCNAVLYGGPASTAIVYAIEVVMNMECLVEVGAVVSGLAKPGEPSNPQIMQAASRVHASHNGHHTQGRPTMVQRMFGFAKNALLDVAASALPYVGGAVQRFLGGGRRTSYPMIRDVD